MNRDEITKVIEASGEVTKNCFYDLLGQLSRPTGFLSPADWDTAYVVALEMVHDYKNLNAESGIN